MCLCVSVCELDGLFGLLYSEFITRLCVCVSVSVSLCVWPEISKTFSKMNGRRKKRDEAAIILEC